MLMVEAIQSGVIGIKWAVVGYNGCGERVDTPNQGGRLVTAETSGRPQIVVNDPDDSGSPKVTYVNKDGSRHLQVFDGRFRLLDIATGAEILNEIGVDPHFSPAGRYLVENEWAITAEDILFRRTKIGITMSKAGVDRLEVFLQNYQHKSDSTHAAEVNR